MKQLILFLWIFGVKSTLTAQDLPTYYDTITRNQEFVLNGNFSYSASGIQKAIISKFYKGGFIDDAIKNASFDRHGAVNRIGIDASTDLTYINYQKRIFKNKPWGFLVKAGYYNFGGLVYSKDAFALGFFGNSNYVGDTMVMSGTNATFTSFQKAGFGLIHPTSKANMSLNFYNISNRFNASFRTLELGQSANGDVVSLAMDGDVFARQNLNFMQGFGFGIDVDYKLEFEWKEGKTAYVQFYAQNIGFAYMNQLQKEYRMDTTFIYSGFTFSEIIGENSIFEDSIDVLDTLGVKSTDANRTIMLPGFLQVSKIVDASSTSKFQSFFGVRLYPTLIYSPCIFAGLNYNPIKSLNLGMNLSYGGFTKFQAGMYVSAQLKKFSLGVGTENVLGFFSAKANGESIKLRLSCVL